ncbi:dihydrofolate reductase family protein [Nonomuraea sp. B19D2]|uniref:dihydrofolate reductase family protein n=1 Tax=Nonomuraea sp. B19D2 TaxID=3159561 RepID=UPI0032DA63B0
MDHSFTASVFIGTSVDGFIAREDGDLGWLISRGEAAGGGEGYGYPDFMSTVDTVVMGRATYEAVTASGWWEYDGKHVAVLSSRLPADRDPRITVYPDLDRLIAGLTDRGTKSVYVDGGQTIRTFLQAGLVQQITITQVPVLIGSGIPLFGPLEADISLTLLSAQALKAGLVQTTYAVEN